MARRGSLDIEEVKRVYREYGTRAEMMDVLLCGAKKLKRALDSIEASEPGFLYKDDPLEVSIFPTNEERLKYRDRLINLDNLHG